MAFTHLLANSVVDVNIAGWSAAVLDLTIGNAFAVTEYNGKLLVSQTGDGIAIVDATSFTETSNLAFASKCDAWDITQFRGVAYINCTQSHGRE